MIELRNHKLKVEHISVLLLLLHHQAVVVDVFSSLCRRIAFQLTLVSKAEWHHQQSDIKVVGILF